MGGNLLLQNTPEELLEYEKDLTLDLIKDMKSVYSVSKRKNIKKDEVIKLLDRIEDTLNTMDLLRKKYETKKEE